MKNTITLDENTQTKLYKIQILNDWKISAAGSYTELLASPERVANTKQGFVNGLDYNSSSTRIGHIPGS